MYFVTIVMTVINQIASVVILNQIFPFDIRDYIRSVIIPCLVMSLLCPIPAFLVKCCMLSSIYRLALVIIVSLLACFVVFYFIVINSEERVMLKSYLFSKIKLSV